MMAWLLNGFLGSSTMSRQGRSRWFMRARMMPCANKVVPPALSPFKRPRQSQLCMSTSPIVISGPTTSTRPAMLADCSADLSRTAGAAPTVPRTADLTPYPSQLTASTTAKICERTSPVSLVCPRPDLLPFNDKFVDSHLITVCRL